MIARLISVAVAALVCHPADAADIYWADPIAETFLRAHDETSFGDPLLAGSEFSLAASPHLRIEGRIESGDEEKLGELLREELPNWQFDMHNQVVVSLNSEGGDFYTGLALSDLIGSYAVMTFVGPGDVCLSSCAIAFLGGQNIMTRGNPPWPARYLHSDAVVGFHAPFSEIPVTIPVPEGTPLDERLTGQLAYSFYGQAQAAINEITMRMSDWNLSPDFVFGMLTKQAMTEDTREVQERFLLIDNYASLIATSSVLVTSELRYPSQITIVAAENACSFITYVNTRKNMLSSGAPGLNYWLYKDAKVIAERPYLDKDENGNPVLGRVETADQQYPKLVSEQSGQFKQTRLIPGSDPRAYYFDRPLTGVGAFQCSVFPFADGRWYAKTFNENIHADDKYGVMRGNEWTPLALLDHEKPYPVSEFVALGFSGSWLNKKLKLPDTGLEEYSEDIRAIDGASFECGGTLDPAAMIICDYPALAAWDGRMTALYRQARERVGASVLNEQRDWIAVRDRVCRPEQLDLSQLRARNDLARCLMDMTRGRAEGLRRQIGN